MPAQYTPTLESMQIENASGVIINSAKEESLVLLRRIAHLLKPLQTITGGGILAGLPDVQAAAREHRDRFSSPG